jgi:ribosomal protein S18 acetylase RimI-like enzyme
LTHEGNASRRVIDSAALTGQNCEALSIDPVIRPLTPDDVEAAFALSSAAGWNQQHADWRMLLGLAPSGSFAATTDGRVIGTSIGIDYGGFAWIAMMLVDPTWRGRGVGGYLLEAAMASVPKHLPVRLDATPRGRSLYERYGFEDETRLTRYVAEDAERRLLPPAKSAVRPLIGADLPTIAARDLEVFGGNRRPVLEWALERAPQYAHVIRSDRRMGYCLGRPGRLFDQIGPVVAEDEDAAQALVCAAISASAHRPVVVDAFDSNEGFAAWLRAAGFRGERPLFRMRRPGQRTSSNGVGLSTRAELAILGPEFA